MEGQCEIPTLEIILNPGYLLSLINRSDYDYDYNYKFHSASENVPNLAEKDLGQIVIQTSVISSFPCIQNWVNEDDPFLYVNLTLTHKRSEDLSFLQAREEMR